ncbi:MAG: acyl-CoA synthetase, partial [Pseudomonadota bacterium]
MHPCIHARTSPNKPAFIMAGSGETVTFKMLDDRSNQGAQLLRASGFQKGDSIAIFAENSARYFELVWAAQRCGLYYVCISSRLTAPEVEYIIQDSGVRALIASDGLADVAIDVKASTQLDDYWSIDGEIEGYKRFETARDAQPASPIADESCGLDMLYSSGTTGRPKGIRMPMDPDAPIDADNILRQIVSGFCGLDDKSIYVSPAPLYHAAPLRWCMAATKGGATLIIMEKFDPEGFLAAVETYKATHAQLVPTMFVRMLKLPEDVRAKYDVSSLTAAIHAAAPCPIPVKEQMIEWWGPVIYEYYAGSEGNGFTWINSEDWLTHKGSVGRAILGVPHICDEAGEELAVGEEGTIYFSGAPLPHYHNDPVKTAECRHVKHQDWSTLGDVGRVDEEGFIYLTDRKAFMIISGGVNIYPQETENVLITHPKVADVAVVGVPSDEFGEDVKAVV